MRAVLFDTETTGLVKTLALPLEKQPYCIEFFGHKGGIKRNEEGKFEWHLIEELEFMANPGFMFGYEITKITGIKNEDVADKPPFKHYSQQVCDLFKGADAVIAHNLSFDMNIINFDIERSGLKEEFKWPEQKICTVEETTHIKGHRMNLTKLHNHLFGKDFSGAHRARDDVNALTNCVVELFNLGIL